jgi:hypothetical protein
LIHPEAIDIDPMNRAGILRCVHPDGIHIRGILRVARFVLLHRTSPVDR